MRPGSWLIFLRIALGVILIWKGIIFLHETSAIKSVLRESHVSVFTKNEALVAVMFTTLILIFGVLILLGFFSRVAALLQLIIFSIAAILYIHGGYITRNGFDLFLTIVIPLLLLLIFTTGSGGFSIDQYLHRRTSRTSSGK